MSVFRPFAHCSRDDHPTIIMYGKEACGFCRDMKKDLKKKGLWNSIEFVDTATLEGRRRFEELGVSGVPHFTCSATRRAATGKMSVQNLLEKLGLR